MPTLKRDYYEVLGVTRGASDQEIKSSYRKIAMKCHPDRNPGDKAAEEQFKEAAEAYSVLGDKEKRTLYDRYGHSGVSSSAGGGAGFNPDLFADFSDILGNFFFGDFFGTAAGGRKRRGGPVRGADLQYHLEISLEETISGIEKQLIFNRLDSCTLCNGTGSTSSESRITCPTCNGYGQVRYNQGFVTIARTCPQCSGAGQVLKDACIKCSGSGRTEEEKMISVKIPPGVDTGNRLKVKGEGEAGIRGGGSGDLYVLIEVNEHSFYKRRNADLFCEKEISMLQAAMGDVITVKTPDGEEKIKILEGTQPGMIHTLRGKGVPHLNSFGRGDLHVQFNVKIPSNWSGNERKLLKDLAKSRKENISPQERGVLEKVKDLLE